MNDWIWILWCVLGLILVVAEVFSSGFVLLWFGIGAFAAGFAGLIGIDSFVLQFLVFAAVSVGLTAASRTIFVNYFSREKTGETLRSGALTHYRARLALLFLPVEEALNEGAVKSSVQPGLPIQRR